MSELFFSKRLYRKIEHIRRAGLTIVEAPAGYGKTTAVREALARCRQFHWYNAIKEAPHGSFDWFLTQIEQTDGQVLVDIRELAASSEDAGDEIAQFLLKLHVSKEMYVVLDNFHYIAHEWPAQILAALARRKPDGLHVICVAQHMGSLHRISLETNKNLCTILKEDLLLNREEIQGLARKKDMELSPARLTSVYEKTDGWAVAVNIYLEHLTEFGEQVFMLSDINDLLHNLFWKQLSAQEKEVLLHLSPYEWVDAKYLDELLPDSNDIDSLHVQELLECVPLLDYNEAKQRYIPHESLLSFLRFQLVVSNEKFHHAVCRHAGNVFRKHGQMRKAVEAYYKAEDYKGILSCNVTGLYMEDFCGNTYRDIAIAVLEKYTKKPQKKYLLNLLRFCYGLYALADFTSYENYIEQVQEIIKETKDEQLAGEGLMVYALHYFPDVKKMRDIYLSAEKKLKKPSEIFVRGEPFMFGATSMLYLFYHERGKMFETADKLDAMMQVYNRLTNGHGDGAAELYRAEAYGALGQFKEAQLFVHKAQLLAENSGNASIVYGTAQLRGINALYQSHIGAAEKAVEYLEKMKRTFAPVYEKRINEYMVDTVRSYILALMMETGRSAPWTRADADSLLDLTFLNFTVKLCRVTDMVLKKEYYKAIASMEATLHMDERLLSLPAYSMMYVGLVMCNMAVGRMHEAVKYLELLLETVRRDKNYVFVSCYQKYFASVMHAPKLLEKYQDTMCEIGQVNIHYTRAEKSRIFDIFEDSVTDWEVLTRREREVALLAAQGLRNAEIAQTLHITENTVKGHMKIIFRKLGVDRRSYLAEILEQNP